MWPRASWGALPRDSSLAVRPLLGGMSLPQLLSHWPKQIPWSASGQGREEVRPCHGSQGQKRDSVSLAVNVDTARFPAPLGIPTTTCGDIVTLPNYDVFPTVYTTDLRDSCPEQVLHRKQPLQRPPATPPAVSPEPGAHACTWPCKALRVCLVCSSPHSRCRVPEGTGCAVSASHPQAEEGPTLSHAPFLCLESPPPGAQSLTWGWGHRIVSLQVPARLRYTLVILLGQEKSQLMKPFWRQRILASQGP